MADEKRQPEESGKECPPLSDTVDETLDFTSEKFDPVKALRVSRLKLPAEVTTSLTSMALFCKSIALELPLKFQSTTSDQVEPSTSKSQNERKFLPHQEPIKSANVFRERNIFTRSQECEGPLQVLKNCMNQRIRVKVITRRGQDIRGYCEGFIVAFDKHWNLALENVIEVWTRKKNQKIAALDSYGTNDDDHKLNRVQQAMSLRPKVTVVRNSRRVETCQRHIAQLMMRGEHVALVVVLPVTSQEPPAPLA